MTNIIGFTGLKGSGKDTAGKILVARGYKNIKFAGALKSMFRAYLSHVGINFEGDQDRIIEGDLKETPLSCLNNKTPREFMQLLGTEFGRNLIGDDFWVEATIAHARNYKNVVITDVRFPNEAQAIIANGGQLYRIQRDTEENAYSLHESESHINSLPVDSVIYNEGSLEDFADEIVLRFLVEPNLGK